MARDPGGAVDALTRRRPLFERASALPSIWA
jgi:hypothetical protein